MNILLISAMSDETIGGISSWTQNYMKYCKDNKINCLLVNTQFEGVRNKNESSFLIKDEIKRLKRINNSLNTALKSFKPDIVHLNSSCSCFGIIRDYYISRRVTKKYKLKLAIHFHCDVEYQINRWSSLMKIVGYIFLNKLMKLEKKCIVLSSSSQDYLMKQFGVSSRIIPNFIDSDIILKHKKEIQKTIKRVVFVGHVIKEKGIENIFEVAKSFLNIEFIVIGEISDEMRSTLSPQENIRIRGVCNPSEVFEELDNADVFMFPSYSEGFSMALMEAMARGVPSIATNVGANKDMLENHGGIIIPVGDSKELKRALKNMENPELRTEMSAWCINKVKVEYVSSTVFNKYLDIYQGEEE